LSEVKRVGENKNERTEGVLSGKQRGARKKTEPEKPRCSIREFVSVGISALSFLCNLVMSNVP